MLLRRVARPMLAALFIQGGINALKAPQAHAEAARPVLDAVGPAMDRVVEAAPIDRRPDDETLIKIDAGVKIVAGSMLALGKFPRLASTALAASLIPTTLASHRFWEEADAKRRSEQQTHFLKNVGLLGGLLIAASDTEGKPSVAWRGKRAARLASEAASSQLASLTGTTSGAGDRLGGAVSEVGGRVSGVAQEASGAVGGLAAGLIGLAPGAGAAVSARASKAGAELSTRASELQEEWSKRAAKAAKKAEKRGAALQKRAEKRRAVIQKLAAKRAAELQKRAAKRGAELAKVAEAKRAELEKRAPVLREQVVALGHDVAERAAAVGSEVAHQAEGAAHDARKRVHALTR